jgi:hypothetical protein
VALASHVLQLVITLAFAVAFAGLNTVEDLTLGEAFAAHVYFIFGISDGPEDLYAHELM